MFKSLRRHMITVAYLKPGIERRASISLLPAIAVITAVIAVPALIAFGAAWKANDVVQGLYARHRALEIETSNYRAAIEALIGQIGSPQSVIQGDGGASAGATTSTRLDPAAEEPVVSGSPAPSARPVPGPAPASAASAAVGPAHPVVTTDGPALAPPMPVAAPVPATPAAGAPASPSAVEAERDGSTEPAWRTAILEALRKLDQTRASAEAAEGPALASESYRAGVTLELEAHELSAAGRMNDALVRAVEADARFRAAEIEARAQTAAWERSSPDDAAATPVLASKALTLAVPAEPAVSPGGGARGLVRAPLPADVEVTIREVIAQYVSGLESRNLAALKRVWPSLGGSQERAIQTEFENARTVHTLFTDPRITIDGDTTTVTGFRMYSLVTHDGQRLSSVTRTTMTLRRNGDAWVIERVVHQQ